MAKKVYDTRDDVDRYEKKVARKRVSPMTKAKQLGAAQAQAHFYNKPKKPTLPAAPWEGMLKGASKGVD